jgi:acetolactate synthase-1/2/3 large subunit
MAVGARIAAPDKPVLAIAGDGGSLFTLTELASAVDRRSQLTVVLWDNAGYGEIRDSFDRAHAARIDTEVTAVDHVKIAEGFGARSSRVEDPEAFGRALKESYEHAGVSVIVATAPDMPAGIRR